MNIGDRVEFTDGTKLPAIYLGKVIIQRECSHRIDKPLVVKPAHWGAKIMFVNAEGKYRVPVTVEFDEIQKPADLMSDIQGDLASVMHNYYRYAEVLAGAYVSATEIPPEECEAVTQSRTTPDGGVEYSTFFRRRDNGIG